MLKRYVFAAVAALLCTPSFAADLPTPSAPKALQYPIASGWFVGVGASGLGGSASSSNAGGGTVVGGRFGADFGYTGLVGNTFYFVEASVSGQLLNGANSQLSVHTSVNFEERFALGVPQSTWTSVLNAIPGLGDIAFPSVPIVGGIQSGPSQPYVFGALYQDDVSGALGGSTGSAWLLSYGAGVGILNRLSNGMMLDTSIEYKHGASGFLIGTTSVQPFEDTYLATARLKF